MKFAHRCLIFVFCGSIAISKFAGIALTIGYKERIFPSHYKRSNKTANANITQDLCSIS